MHEMNVAVIGLGVGQTHLQSYNALPDVRIAAIADIDEDRLRARAETYQVPRAYTDYQDLLAQGDIDAVSICLPNYLHAPVTIAALEAGKHVLVEKPMARTAVEAQTMIDAAEEHNRTLAVGMNYRWLLSPHARYLKHLIEDGRLGEVYYVRSVALRRRTFLRGHKTWFSDKERSGGGGLVDMGPHMLDLAMWLSGDFSPVRVSGVTRTAIMVDTDVDDLASALVGLAGGATISLEITWESYTRGHFSVTVYGTKGGAVLDGFHPSPRLTLFGEEDTGLLETTVSDIHLPEPVEATVQEHFLKCIRAGRQPEVTGECGLAAMRVIDAVYESSATGQTVVIAP